MPVQRGPLFAVQVVSDRQKCRHRVVDFDDGQALADLGAPGVEVRADQSGRGRRALQELGVPLALDERDVTRPRLADRPRRADRDAAITDQATANQRRQLFHRCDHGRFPFFLERRRRGPKASRVEQVRFRPVRVGQFNPFEVRRTRQSQRSSRQSGMLIHVAWRGKPSRRIRTINRPDSSRPAT